MFSKETVRKVYKLANQNYFEEKYKEQFQSILDEANNRRTYVIFSQNECPFELAQYLMDELKFGLWGFKEDRWIPIFEIEEVKNCERIQVRW